MENSGGVAKLSRNLVFVYAFFLLSGCTALIYEITWQRLLLRVLGSTLPAVTIVLCIFMIGLAIGALLCGNLLRAWNKPLLVYGALEILIGLISACSLPYFATEPHSLVSAFDGLVSSLFSLKNSTQFDSFNPLFWSRAIYASMFLLVPTTLMGSTFPCISAYLERNGLPQKSQANAYTINLVGAAIGTILSGFFLLPTLGIASTVLTSCAISVILGFGILLLQKKSKPKQSVVELDSRSASSPSPLSSSSDPFFTLPVLASVVLVNAALGMSLEVIWSRLFSLLVGNSTYSVASVFAVSIVGLALGAWMSQHLGAKIRNSKLYIAFLSLGIASALVLDLIFVIQNLPWLVNSLHIFFRANNSYAAYLTERVLTISLVVLLPSVLCGGVFPAAVSAAIESKERENLLGKLYAVSSLGSVIGAALSGFLFIPLLGRIFPSGLESTICLLIALECLVSLFLFLRSSRKILVIAPLLVLAVLVVGRPTWNQSLMSSGIPFLSLPSKAAKTKDVFDRLLSDGANNKLLFYREGLNTTVTVSVNRQQNIVYLKNDGKVEAALPFDRNREANTSDLTTQTLLGVIPTSVVDKDAQEVFVVGLGSGATCGGALSSARVKRLSVAEIEPTIFEVNHFFEQSNGNPLRPDWVESGRVSPFCGDARLALNFSKHNYDAIISQPAEPWISGSSDLYTREFWTLARSRLHDHGCFCQWMQLYSIDPEYLAVLLRTFQSVFPNTYVFHSPRAGELILLGSIKPVDFSSRLLATQPVVLPDSLREKVLSLALRYKNAKFNTDDNLLTEYALPERLYLSEQLIDENLKALEISQ